MTFASSVATMRANSHARTVMKKISPCPNCHGRNVYRSDEVSAGGGHAPNYLPGLGGFWAAEKFHMVLCHDCGLTRFFARPSALEKLVDSAKWTRVTT